MSTDRTLLIVKPDGVQRGLTGRIITQLEDAGLELRALKMVTADRELIRRHYPDAAEWLATVGQKTLDDYRERGIDPQAELGTDDATEIGRRIKQWLVEYLTSGPVVAMVLAGTSAVENVRRLCGHTLPTKADPGSIRGRYSCDSPQAANAERRPIRNVVHASGNAEEAEFEIDLWFAAGEVA